MEKQKSRRRVRQVHVPVLPSEMTELKRNAGACGLSLAAYLRTVGLHYQPKGVFDTNAVLELAKVNGDLGRLGGLLKMWLTNDDRLKKIGKEEVVPVINGILNEIVTAQTQLLEAAKRV